jgi:hypothetical protein
MAYTINLTDGAIFATIPDGTIDTSSSMILVGKNYAGYGEFLDENFIHLLENGANNVPPSAPLVGQLWWDKSTNTMKVYTGNTFKVISGATSSASAPTLSNVPGDLWWDTANGQLKVWNGASFTLIGPASSGPGVSGAIVTTITDNVAVPHVVVQLFVDNTIVGMISKDATFTPQTPIPGFAQIAPGIQLSTAVPNALFRGTALNANTLESLAASAFMRTGINTSTSGTLAVLNDAGLTVGLDQDARISVTTATSEVIVDNQTSDANLSMRINRGGSSTTVLRALGNTGEVTFPAAAGVSVTGNITVPQIVKSGANNSGNIGSSTNVFNTVFANTFQGTVAVANNVSGTVAVANGGTGRNTLNPGAVLLGNGTANVNFVAPGTDGNVLTASGGTWISVAPSGNGGGTSTSIVNGTSNVTVIAPNGNVQAAVNGTTIQTISSTGVEVTGRVIATGNVYVDSGATRGLVYDQANNQVAVGIASGTGIFFKSTSPTGNIDIVAGNTVTTGNVLASGQITGNGFLSTTRTFNFDSTSAIYKQSTGNEVRIDGNGVNLMSFKVVGDSYQALIANQSIGIAYDSVTGDTGIGKIGGPAWLMTGTGVGGNIEAVAGNVIIGGSGRFIGNVLGQLHNFSGSTAIYGNNSSGGEWQEVSVDVVGARKMLLTTTRNRMFQTTIPDADNAYSLGESGQRWTAVWAVNGAIQTSDERLKTDVIDSPLGLSFIDKLRPVAYRWIVGQNVEDGYDEQAILDENGDVKQLIKIPKYKPRPGVRTHYGLLSQEVKSVLDQEAVGDFAGWVLTDKEDPDSEQGLNYGEFIAPMIQAIKELKAELDETKARLAELESKSE